MNNHEGNSYNTYYRQLDVRNASLLSQGKGNLWLQKITHKYATKEPFFNENMADKTEFGGMIRGSTPVSP